MGEKHRIHIYVVTVDIGTLCEFEHIADHRSKILHRETVVFRNVNRLILLDSLYIISAVLCRKIPFALVSRLYSVIIGRRKAFYSSFGTQRSLYCAT